MMNDDSNLFLSNDPQDLEHATSEASFVVKSTDVKVTDSLLDTTRMILVIIIK